MLKDNVLAKAVIPLAARRRLRRFYNYADISYLRTQNRLSTRTLVDDGQGAVVSLTTYAPRLHVVFLAIESLFRQSVLPSAIYLWLCEEEICEADIPTELRRLQNRGLKLEFVSKNLYSANKLAHAAKRFPDRRIITVDDDLIYPPNSLEALLRANGATPDVIVCHRGHFLTLENCCELHPYNEIMQNGLGGSCPSFNLLPTGTAGVLYPPGSLNPLIDDADLMMRLCPRADDIWFKAMSLLQGKKSRRVGEKNFLPPSVPGTQEVSLYSINRNENDTQLRDVFRYFNLYDRLKDPVSHVGY